jgi:hypothetical protein
MLSHGEATGGGAPQGPASNHGVGEGVARVAPPPPQAASSEATIATPENARFTLS